MIKNKKARFVIELNGENQVITATRIGQKIQNLINKLLVTHSVNIITELSDDGKKWERQKIEFVK